MLTISLHPAAGAVRYCGFDRLSQTPLPMFAHVFRLPPQFRWRNRTIHLERLHHLLQPRKPRHHVMRVLVALVGVMVLAALLVVGVVVGTGMLAVGLTWKLLARRPAQRVPQADVLEGDYRVVTRAALPR